jgi:hypothetical protein
LIHGIHISLVYVILLLFILCIVIVHPTRRFPNPIFIFIVPKVPNIQSGGVIPVASSNTPPSLEHDLPNTRYPSQQISNHRPVPYVPHLQSPIRAAQHLELIMLETGDGSGMSS